MSRSTEPLVVLQSVPPPRETTNPYIVQLFQSLRGAGVEVLPFSWRSALLGRYDVFHVHWPENLIRGSNRLRTSVRSLLVLLLTLRLTVTRTPIVRTLHNLAEHEDPTRTGRTALSLLIRRTRMLILINSETRPTTTTAAVTILHGHYRDWYGRFEATDRVPRRLAYFGLIRPYKGVEDLLRTFFLVDDPGATLTVAGNPRTPELGAELRRLAAVDPRVSLELAYIADERLREVVTASELVVLPYRAMHNSGAALAALSMDRPVLVPDTPATRSLRREVGEGWVHLFTGELEPGDLTRALREVHERGTTGERPNLSAREWAGAGARHRDAYVAAVAGTSGERRPLRRPLAG